MGGGQRIQVVTSMHTYELRADGLLKG